MILRGQFDKKYNDNIPIGYPISNSTCYIVSKNMKLLPVGVPGELVVGGDGVGLGYLNNKDYTQEKFIKNPFIKNDIIYKTGDLAVWDSNGVISFIGRIDNQVKVRGLYEKITPEEFVLSPRFNEVNINFNDDIQRTIFWKKYSQYFD